MPKLQLHAIVIIIILGAAIMGSKCIKPMIVQGRPDTDFSRIPLELNIWHGIERKFDESTYKSLPSCSLLLRYYERDDVQEPVELAIVYGTDLGDFHQPEFCLEGQGLKSMEKGRIMVKSADGTSFEAVKLISEGSYGRQAFIFWFSSDKATSTFLGNYKAKVFLDRLLARKVEPSAMIRVSTPVVGTDDEAVKMLSDFADALIPYLKKEFAAAD